MVSIPHGWGHDLPGVRLGVAGRHAGVNSNVLAEGDRFDPLSGTAVLNGIPVTVRPAARTRPRNTVTWNRSPHTGNFRHWGDAFRGGGAVRVRILAVVVVVAWRWPAFARPGVRPGPNWTVTASGRGNHGSFSPAAGRSRSATP